MDKINVAIIGPGNIGTDLMYKIFRSDILELKLMAGIVESEGIKRARDLGVDVSTNGVDGVLERDDIQIVFDATSAAAHHKAAPLLKEAGIFTFDLTPAAVGPYMVPSVNLDAIGEDEMNVNLVTCGGQATVPMVYAISKVVDIDYAEIVSAVSAFSAGSGTRKNIDEFTETTRKALEQLGGAKHARAIIILNPADPPVLMSNTIYVEPTDKNVNMDDVNKAVNEMLEEIQKFVPGYQLVVPPTFDGDKITMSMKVEGAGDFLPVYSGNLDIINAAAVHSAELVAKKMMNGGTK